MANNVSRNPLVIDTAGGSPITTQQLRIRKLRWVGGSAAGHQAIVQDQFGNVFWESIAAGANYVEETDFSTDLTQRTVVSGLTVPTLGSGKLYIYE
jgi:hypothetical protein